MLWCLPKLIWIVMLLIWLALISYKSNQLQVDKTLSCSVNNVTHMKFWSRFPHLHILLFDISPAAVFASFPVASCPSFLPFCASWSELSLFTCRQCLAASGTCHSVFFHWIHYCIFGWRPLITTSSSSSGQDFITITLTLRNLASCPSLSTKLSFMFHSSDAIHMAVRRCSKIQHIS